MSENLAEPMTELSRPPILDALEPSRSVVVEACAGSGKTWLLASRIVRLLLSGIAPGEILAITFTRKAAREIEERVVDWLHLLATGSDAQVLVFLGERGVSADTALLRNARGLYERVLVAQPRLAVNTFHGWFLQLVDAAPLSANLSGATLVETDSRLFDEYLRREVPGLDPLDAVGFTALVTAAHNHVLRRLLRGERAVPLSALQSALDDALRRYGVGPQTAQDAGDQEQIVVAVFPRAMPGAEVARRLAESL